VESVARRLAAGKRRDFPQGETADVELHAAPQQSQDARCLASAAELAGETDAGNE
jgi:hypothetical protein